MDIERILRNDMSLLIGRSDEGKTNFLCVIIKEYKVQFKGDVWVYGLDDDIVEKLKINTFSSVLEMESIKNSIIIIDEVGKLMDLSNRKLKPLIEDCFRMVNRNGNKLLLCGLPMDFKRYICAKAKCFIYKSLNMSDLINGTLAKEILYQYRGDGKGIHSFVIDKNQALVYDNRFYIETTPYLEDMDKKKDNVNLFQKKCKKVQKV